MSILCNLRLKAIDDLVESHWQDPIETIPETVGARTITESSLNWI